MKKILRFLLLLDKFINPLKTEEQWNKYFTRWELVKKEESK